MSSALASMVCGPSELYAESGTMVKSAIGLLVDRAVASGDIRLDIDPLDLLRALAGVASISSAPPWLGGGEESARRLVDILIAGVPDPDWRIIQTLRRPGDERSDGSALPL